MKVNLARSAGFCLGVKRAIDIALKKLSSCKNVYMLGDIVHNEEVASEMKKAGLKTIEKLVPGKDRVFLIRAHGISSKLLNNARSLGYKIVDATCPMVKGIHKIAIEMEKKGYAVIVIGDKEHDEVRGITGQLKKKAILIQGPEDIPLEKINKINKAAIVVQSTQNIEKVLEIVNCIKPCVEELKFFNTICRPTRVKQQEIRKMPLENDVMVIIGSKSSANTQRLFEISKSLNKRSFWIQDKRDIKCGWFKQAQSVGITAGASTPEYIIKEIVEYIKTIS